MTCIAMQPLITSCCYEGMRMLHGTACAAAATRRPRDGATCIRAAPEGRRFKEADAAHPAATGQGPAIGWPPRRCGKWPGQAFLGILFFIYFSVVTLQQQAVGLPTETLKVPFDRTCLT